MANQKFSQGRWLWLGVAAVVAFVFVLCSTAGPFRFVRGQRMSAAAANARLWHCQVPPEATDVWFVSGYRGTQVECSITLEQFQSWCQRHGWKPIRIDADDPQYVTPLNSPGKPVGVSKGYHFSDLRGDIGYHGVYDLGKGRSYVWFSGG